MKQPITHIRAKNFRSLGDVDVPLAPLTVLVGPNGAGKTNVLNVLRFLATTVRLDLAAALHQWRGFERIQRQTRRPGAVSLTVEGHITTNSSLTAPDVYTLSLSENSSGSVRRLEEFTFKRKGGQGRRLTVKGDRVTFYDVIDQSEHETASRSLATSQTTGLATLPKLSDDDGGEGIRRFTEFLTSVRVLEPDIASARQPARDLGGSLTEDAGNLADVLARIRRTDEDAWQSLVHDVAQCLPGLKDIALVPVGGTARSVAVQLIERGVRQPIDLADASFGTVRLLTLLAALHEPEPAPFIAIEEIDHGLHPYALDLLVDRLRAASLRTQILAATHSPTLLNRLSPEEFVVCGRDPETGESIIPAISQEQVRAAMAASDWRAGELWFSGAIGGIPTP